MKVRIKFRKYGSMKFIGHLDIMRYFQKAIRRAGIPVAYSGGYSPHQIMSFAAPLGVGLESNGEYMDIELREAQEQDGGQAGEIAMRESLPMEPRGIKDALNSTMAEGMEIISVRKLPDTAGNAMASVAAARYTVRFREGYGPEFDWKSQFLQFCGRETIPVKKQTKKSVREFDLKPYLFEHEIKEDAVMLLVDASSAGNVKPSLVMEAFYEACGAGTLSPYALQVTREETYGRRDGTEAGGELIPLEDFGLAE